MAQFQLKRCSLVYTYDNLPSIDNMDSQIRRACFMHFSVHEFLTSHRSISKLIPLEYEIAHREIARICKNFVLILYCQIQDNCTAVEDSFANNYILPALPHHLLAGNLGSLPPNDEMINLTQFFFSKGPPMLASPHDANTRRTFFTFSPSVLALVFNIPGTYQDYNSQVLHGEQLDHKVLIWIYGGSGRRFFEKVSDNRFAMHYAIGQLDSVAVG